MNENSEETKTGDPGEDLQTPVRNLTFTTPLRQGTAVLSPLPGEITRFAQVVIGILQRVVPDNDDAISYGVGEFLRASRITNEDALSLLREEDIPTGPDNSIWTSAVF